MSYVHLLPDLRMPDLRMNDTPNRPLLNARLMSAVPAMLEALKHADRDISMYHSAMKDHDLLSGTLRHIRRALAQAEAET
jgi:hypothetical protein